MASRPEPGHLSGVQRIVLRDGSTVHIRPITSDDKAALSQAVDNMTADSRYRRFLSAIRHLDSSALTYFTDIDHTSHEALVAIDPGNGELIGVARYIRLPDEPTTAEAAMFVADGWHGRGLATVLLTELTTLARAAGVESFVATCLTFNRDAIDVLRSLGPTTMHHHAGGIVELRVKLSAGTADQALQTALGHAASGQLAIEPTAHTLTA